MKKIVIAIFAALIMIISTTCVFAQNMVQDIEPDNLEGLKATASEQTDRSPGVTNAESVGQEFEYYDNDDGTITVNKYNGNAAEIVVPAQIDGKIVRDVYELAPSETVTSIEFSEGIQRISANLLCHYPNLANLVLPSTLERSMYIDSDYTIYIKGTKLKNLNGFAKENTKLQYLSITDSNLTDISGLAGWANLKQLSLEGNSALTNVSILKEWDNLSYLNLNGTSVSQADALKIVHGKDMVLPIVVSRKFLSLCPRTIMMNDTNVLSGITYQVKDTTIAKNEGGEIIPQKIGMTTCSIMFNAQEIASVNINVVAVDSEQPVGADAKAVPEIKPELIISKGSDSRFLLGYYSDKTLWRIGGDKPYQVMSNVQSFSNAVNEGSLEMVYALVEDENASLHTLNLYNEDVKELNPSIPLVKKYDIAPEYSVLNIRGIALSEKGELFFINKNNSATQMMTGVSDYKIDTSTEMVLVLKETGELWMCPYSGSDAANGTAKFSEAAEGVNGLYDGVNGTVYFKKGDTFGGIESTYNTTTHMFEKQVVNFDGGIKNQLKLWNGRFWIKTDGTTGEGDQKLLDKTVVALEYNYLDSFYYALDTDHTLWKFKQEDSQWTVSKIADNVTDCNDLANLGTDFAYYVSGDVMHKLSTGEKTYDDVKQVLPISNTYTYVLKNDGYVYLNNHKILNHVEKMVKDSSMPYFVRTDGSTWCFDVDNDEPLTKVADDLSALAYPLGDINADKAINASDALQALRHSVGEIKLEGDAFTRGDVTKDKKINASDALQILRYSVKEITSFD